MTKTAKSLSDYIQSEDYAKAHALLLHAPEEDKDEEFYALAADLMLREGLAVRFFEMLREGLRKNPRNYELYVLLGEYYLSEDAEKALTCFTQALLYCEVEEDRKAILGMRQELKESTGAEERKTAFIIPLIDTDASVKLCVDTLCISVPEEYREIIAVAGEDTSEEALQIVQEDEAVTLVTTEGNDYGHLCNAGAKAASPETDLFFMEPDTMLLPNTFFYLKLGMEAETGGISGMSNIAYGGQRLKEKVTSYEDATRIGQEVNLPSLDAVEDRFCLCEFALLITRKAWEESGGFDETLESDCYEAFDLGLRLFRNGYMLQVCHNSFCVRSDIKSYERRDAAKFREKWGFNVVYYMNARDDLVDRFTCRKNDPICVLEVGCGMGVTLQHILHRFPNAKVQGIELCEEVLGFGKLQETIRQGNVEEMNLDYDENSFDYILFGDVLEHLRDPHALLRKLRPFLKESGEILASIPNLMHISVLSELIRGNFTYQDEGLLDRTHIHFFTKNEIERMFDSCGFETMEYISIRVPERTPEETDTIQKLTEISGAADEKEFRAFQYLVRAKKKGY